MKLIKIETEKIIKEAIDLIEKKAKDYDFIIRDIFDMAYEFRHHGVDVETNFKYYSIMLCNPEKAYKSILNNLIRGALLLPPKQVVVYSEGKKTIIAYVFLEEDDIKKLFPEDKQFQKGLSESCSKIVKLIEAVGGVLKDALDK